MATLTIHPLEVNPESACAAAGATYAFNHYSGLSFGEVLLAVCLERATFLEASSVTSLAQLEENTLTLEAYASAAQMVLGGASPGEPMPLPSGMNTASGQSTLTLAAFLTEEAGLTLPEAAWSFSDRMAIYADLKARMGPLQSQSQEALIDLQSLLNARDNLLHLATQSIESVHLTAQKSTASL